MHGREIRSDARPWGLLALFTVAFGIRLLLSAVSDTLTAYPNNSNLVLTAGGYVTTQAPSAFLPPGTYYVNWVMFTLLGSNVTAFSVALALIGAALPLVAISLSRALLPDRSRAPVIAGWLVAAGFPFIFLSTTWSYMLFPVLFGALHGLAIVTVRGTPIRWMLIVIGTGTALLLTRPDYYLAGALLAVCTGTGWRWRLGAVLGPVVLVSLHNFVVMGTVSMTPGNLWYNLDAGNSPNAREAIIGYGPDRWHPELTMSGIPQEDAVGHRRRVQEFLHHQPGRALEGLVMKIARIFDVRRDGALHQGALENSGYTAFVIGVQTLGAIGLGMALASNAVTVRPFLLLFVGYAFPMVLFFSLDRTRVLLQLLWALYAAWAISNLVGPYSEAGASSSAEPAHS